METPEHLGGHGGVTHIDVGALDWAISEYEVKTAIDVGCGVGDMVKHMLDRGIDARGIEGDPALNWGRPEKFIRWDYTKGPCVPDNTTDLGWCVEVLEHIEEQYLDNVMATFKECKVLIVTAAPPGTESAHHHVNCKTDIYWMYQFAKAGFRFDDQATMRMRAKSTMAREFMKNTGMVFVREEGYGVDSMPQWIRIENEALLPAEEILAAEEEIEIPEYVGHPVNSEEEITTEDEPKDLREVFEERVEEKLAKKLDLPDNKKLIIEEDKYYVITLTKTGKERKGSRKEVEAFNE